MQQGRDTQRTTTVFDIHYVRSDSVACTFGMHVEGKEQKIVCADLLATTVGVPSRMIETLRTAKGHALYVMHLHHGLQICNFEGNAVQGASLNVCGMSGSKRLGVSKAFVMYAVATSPRTWLTSVTSHRQGAPSNIRSTSF